MLDRRAHQFCCLACAMLVFPAPTALIVAQAPSPPAAAPVGIVEGRVLGPLGEPMPNIEVVAVGRGKAPPVGRCRTDGDGFFRMSRVPIEQGASIRASAPGTTTSRAYASISPAQPLAGVEIRLWEANVLRGRVVDPDGRPVVDGAVLGTKDLCWFGGGFESPEARTDGEGRFELPGVPIGDCVIRAWAPGFVMREHTLFAVADTEVVVRLDRGEGVKLVLQAEGLPAGLAPPPRVSIYPMRGGSGFELPGCIENTALDASARLELTGLPDAEWNVQLTAPGFTFDPRTIETKAGRLAHELRFRAVADGSMQLRGTLRSEDGRPLAGQQLLCRTQRSQSMNGGRPGMATTDEQGRFVMTAPLVEDEPYSLHLVDSTWVLLQKKTRGHTGAHDLRYLVRHEGKASSQEELALVARPAAMVTATLVDAEGRPVPFVWTELQSWRENTHPPWGAVAYATSTRDGRVVFPGVHGTGNDMRIKAEARGAGESEPFRLEPGARFDVKIVMSRPGSIRGRVLDADGKPRPGVRVSLRNLDLATGNQTDGSWSDVPTDRLGRFVFTDVSPGGHRVETGLHGGDPKARSEMFEVKPGATATVDVQFAR
jgi:hypothetical protein